MQDNAALQENNQNIINLKNSIKQRMPEVADVLINQWVQQNLQYFALVQNRLTIRPPLALEFIVKQIPPKHTEIINTFKMLQSEFGDEIYNYIESLEILMKKEANSAKIAQDQVREDIKRTALECYQIQQQCVQLENQILREIEEK